MSAASTALPESILWIEMGENRVATKPGMGAVRPNRAPSGPTRRVGPITCPSLKAPTLEEVGTSSSVDSRRRPDTLKRAASSDGKVRTSRVTLASAPRAMRPASDIGNKRIEPTDAFLLSRIDGELTAADLADLTGMSPKDVLASLDRLLRAGLVEVD